MNYIGIAVIIFIVITLGIGFWTYFKIQGKAVNYFKAGAMMPVWVVGISLIAPAIDANGSIGAASRSAELGFWSGASIPIGLAICMFLLGRFVAVPVWKMNIMTLADFYARRYNKTTETLATLSMLVSGIILLAGNIAGLGILFSRVFGFAFLPMIIIIGSCILIYSLTGGFITSLSTSVFQVVLFVIGIFLAFFWLSSHYGWGELMLSVPLDLKSYAGLTKIGNGALENWAAIISLGLGNIVALDLIQRVISSESPRAAQKSCYMGAVLILLVAIPVSIIGLFSIHLNKTSGFSLLIDLAMEDLPGWIGLLLILGIIAASLAVASGVILAMANAITRNILQPYSNSKWDNKKLLKISRLMAIPAMSAAIIFAYIRPEPGTLLILAFDIVLAGCFVPFVFGIYWKKSNALAAIIAIIVGAAIRLLLFFVVPKELGGLDTLLPPFITAVLFIIIARSTQKISPPEYGAFDETPTDEQLVSGEF